MGGKWCQQKLCFIPAYKTIHLLNDSRHKAWTIKDASGRTRSLHGTRDSPRIQGTAVSVSQDLRHCRESHLCKKQCPQVSSPLQDDIAVPLSGTVGTLHSLVLPMCTASSSCTPLLAAVSFPQPEGNAGGQLGVQLLTLRATPPSHLLTTAAQPPSVLH